MGSSLLLHRDTAPCTVSTCAAVWYGEVQVEGEGQKLAITLHSSALSRALYAR